MRNGIFFKHILSILIQRTIPVIMYKLLLLFVLIHVCPAYAGELEVPRVVIALYDSRVTPKIQLSLAHSLAEMPLNHLGLKLEYYDVNSALPAIAAREDVRGVLSWFNTETRLNDPEKYLKWAALAVDAGKKFVILGNPGFYENSQGKASSVNSINFFLKKLGLYTRLEWVNLTYKTTLTYPTQAMFLPGKTITGIKPSYVQMLLLDKSVTSHLKATTGTKESQMVVTSPHGGYVADGYSHAAHDGKDEEIAQWYLNPFTFFGEAFATDDMPKPDTTTLAGRRIFYSHIDGDGWNNYSQIEAYKKNRLLSSAVIMERVAKAYPDLPLTLTVIAADIDPNWSGSAESRKVAKDFFALPNVEAGSHTYSHPFSWAFFEDGNWQKEQPYLHLYPDGSWGDGKETSFAHLLSSQKPKGDATGGLPHGYTTPRAYAKEPFDINKEITGAIAMLTPLLPAGKKIELITWPGDCSPWEGAISLARKAGVHNINGGDSRFDPEYPSYASVAPIGRMVGKEQQIYASSSNENTYTELWNGRFYGFKYLVESLKNTESPVRIKPLNIYYHIYSGEKQAGLNAVLSNLNYASAQEITPVTARQFTNIAMGFYSTIFTPLGNNSWRVSQRGDLDTIRFDHANRKTVDFTRSSGVVGQRHFQGSLYIYLDKTVRSPVIALKETVLSRKEAAATPPYLVDGRWQVRELVQKAQSFAFIAEGFGKGEMRWQVPASGRYRISVGNSQKIVRVGDSRVLSFIVQHLAVNSPVKIAVEKLGS